MKQIDAIDKQYMKDEHPDFNPGDTIKTSRSALPRSVTGTMASAVSRERNLPASSARASCLDRLSADVRARIVERLRPDEVDPGEATLHPEAL